MYVWILISLLLLLYARRFICAGVKGLIKQVRDLARRGIKRRVPKIGISWLAKSLELRERLNYLRYQKP